MSLPYATDNFSLLSESLLLWGYVNVFYSFHGFAEPESSRDGTSLIISLHPTPPTSMYEAANDL